MTSKDQPNYPPPEHNPDIAALWPDISGNEINGFGDANAGRPRPVFWRRDESTPHAPVMYYFFDRYKNDEQIAKAREYRDHTAAIPVNDIASEMEAQSSGEWTAWIKQAVLAAGADDVGICAYREEWSFDDRPKPQGKWAVVMAFKQSYKHMLTAPASEAYIEVMGQYGRAGDTSKMLANQIRERGHYAVAKTGPMTEDVLMIPAAIESGLGELGKHGSMIHRQFGSNFRLSLVLTDLPLEADAREVFGADAFCTNCQVCANACPPDAIYRDKQMVRGESKWYVDFDKCIPYFVDNKTCGICLVVCPWSRPGVADNLVAKMAKRLDSPGS